MGLRAQFLMALANLNWLLSWYVFLHLLPISFHFRSHLLSVTPSSGTKFHTWPSSEFWPDLLSFLPLSHSTLITSSTHLVSSPFYLSYIHKLNFTFNFHFLLQPPSTLNKLENHFFIYLIDHQLFIRFLIFWNACVQGGELHRAPGHVQCGPVTCKCCG